LLIDKFISGTETLVKYSSDQVLTPGCLC